MLVLRHIAFLAVLALAAPLVIAPAHALVDGPWIEEEPARYRMIAAGGGRNALCCFANWN